MEPTVPVSMLPDMLESIRNSLQSFAAEITLIAGVVLMVTLGLFHRLSRKVFHILAIATFLLSASALVMSSPLTESESLFNGMLVFDSLGNYFKFIFIIASILTVVMTLLKTQRQQRLPEYYTLIITICLGANLLVSSTNFVMSFLALELISIPSYVLAGFAFTRSSSEGSLKYFIFGAAASAIMLYGMSLLYGITGTMDFRSDQFTESIQHRSDALFIIGALFTLAGFFYKIASAPMHPWAPDVYEGAPIAIVAFFSTVPKLAGLGILARFIYVIDKSGSTPLYWQTLLAAVAILTIAVGNLSALWQKNPKRMMAYSSIAQSGFMLVGLAAFPTIGLENLLFYATVFVALNYLVFIYLSYFEDRGVNDIPSFAGLGPRHVWPCVFILVGLIGLTGLPPTAGFTAKLLIFSSLWQVYSTSEKVIMLVLLVWGLLNTVISLFYYLRIPYYAFIKRHGDVPEGKIITWENLFGLFLVLVVLILFFSPGLLMGWINKINFVL